MAASKERDHAAGYEVLDNFQRFSQKYDMFCRSFWDPNMRSAKSERFYATYRTTLKNWKRAEGFTQKDYALRNASWHVTDLFAELNEDGGRREGFLDEFTVLRECAPDTIPVESPAAMSAELKRVAKVIGADLIGITELDKRWLYTHKFSAKTLSEKPQEIPDDLPNAIVIAQSMDRGLIETVPSALSGAATGLGYSLDTVVLLTLTQYIRNLGYRAVASMNDSALAIPLALNAGLGEYGRNGLLITKEYGPRVRLGKIFTDLPLAHDQPISFGVREFCEGCRKCADACPVKAISFDAPSAEVYNESNLVGVRKWSTNAESCFGFWVNQNSDCSICIRTCPYNKDFSKWRHRLGRELAGTGLRKMMLWLDDRLGYGERKSPNQWWRQP